MAADRDHVCRAAPSATRGSVVVDELDELRGARNLGQLMEVIAERTLEFMESGATQPHTIRIMLGKPIRVVFEDSDPPVPSEPRP
ncbi:MAG: hypothetical protein ABIV93_07880, partial [Byssovorax sp.]